MNGLVLFALIIIIGLLITRRRPDPPMLYVTTVPPEPPGLGCVPWVIVGLALFVLWALLAT